MMADERLSAERLAELRATHQIGSGTPQFGEDCRYCERWPCDGAALLAHVDAQAAELERLRAWLKYATYNMTYPGVQARLEQAMQGAPWTEER